VLALSLFSTTTDIFISRRLPAQPAVPTSPAARSLSPVLHPQEEGAAGTRLLQRRATEPTSPPLTPLTMSVLRRCAAEMPPPTTTTTTTTPHARRHTFNAGVSSSLAVKMDPDSLALFDPMLDSVSTPR
jgi:hypothetical protein